MSKKRPVLPSSGGSYLRKSGKLQQVEKPTEELHSSDLEMLTQAHEAKTAKEDTDQ